MLWTRCNGGAVCDVKVDVDVDDSIKSCIACDLYEKLQTSLSVSTPLISSGQYHASDLLISTLVKVSFQCVLNS